MGGVIRDYEDKRETALSLLLEVGALTTCPIHSDEIIEGSMDVELAYRKAMYLWSKGRHPEFENAREFTDYIKSIYEEYSDTECGLCADLRDS